MIKYNLICDAAHEFEGWFRSSSDYDDQAEAGLLECPACGSQSVQKAVMAPAIARSRDSGREQRFHQMRQSMQEAVQRARDYVEQNFDYVGDQFSDEARRIHYGESEERGIYGEASGAEVRDLVEEGIEVAPLPGASASSDGAGEAPSGDKPDSKKIN